MTNKPTTRAAASPEPGALDALVRTIAAEAYKHWDADRDSKVGKLLAALAGTTGIRLDLDGVRAAAPRADAMAGGVTEAVRSILAERERQRTVEGWTEAHDDAHTEEELGIAAACYALPEGYGGRAIGRPLEVPDLWPWDAEWWKPTPDDRRRELVKAGALIIAEIERLDRAALRAAQPETSGGEG